MTPAAALVVALAATVAVPAPAPLAPLRDERVVESSGLVASPTHRDLVWTVNDSGSDAEVFGLSPTTGRTRAVLRLRDPAGGATDVRDTEAMTAATVDGRGLLWIGDVGDNRRVRESVVLRLVREPRTVASADVTPVSLRVRYPDGPVDVEAMLWTGDRRLLLVTKELLSARVLEVPPAAVAAAVAGRSTTVPVLAREVGVALQSLVTDGAALPDGRIVLRGYGDATVYEEPGRPGAGDRVLEALAAVALPDQDQGETLAVEPGGRSVLVGSEGVGQRLWRVAVPRAVVKEGSSPTAATSSGAATVGLSSRGVGVGVGSEQSGSSVVVRRAAAAAAVLLALLLAVALRRRARRLRGARPRGRRTG